MITIVYTSKHGATSKIARVINTYLDHACTLMNLDELDMAVLEKTDTIVLGVPVYYGALDPKMVEFIKKNQGLLIKKHYSIYITALFHTEFMSYITKEFDYSILKNVTTMAGLGGAIYYPDLSIQEKMVLAIMNKNRPIIPKEHHVNIFENFDNHEIELFSQKIKRIEDYAVKAK